MIELLRFVDSSGHDVIGRWLAGLRDAKARARIAARVARLGLGNFGDCKPVGEGVSELRIDYGPGYRVYYATLGAKRVLLLGGGDKRKQTTDIKRAIENWKEYQLRTTN
jgi:putative addiction module killer protein